MQFATNRVSWSFGDSGFDFCIVVGLVGGHPYMPGFNVDRGTFHSHVFFATIRRKTNVSLQTWSASPNGTNNPKTMVTRPMSLMHDQSREDVGMAFQAIATVFIDFFAQVGHRATQFNMQFRVQNVYGLPRKWAFWHIAPLPEICKYLIGDPFVAETVMCTCSTLANIWQSVIGWTFSLMVLLHQTLQGKISGCGLWSECFKIGPQFLPSIGLQFWSLWQNHCISINWWRRPWLAGAESHSNNGGDSKPLLIYFEYWWIWACPTEDFGAFWQQHCSQQHPGRVAPKVLHAVGWYLFLILRNNFSCKKVAAQFVVEGNEGVNALSKKRMLLALRSCGHLGVAEKWAALYNQPRRRGSDCRHSWIFCVEQFLLFPLFSTVFFFHSLFMFIKKILMKEKEKLLYTHMTLPGRIHHFGRSGVAPLFGSLVWCRRFESRWWSTFFSFHVS